MRFECQKCGNCCKLGGSIRFIKGDLHSISQHLGLSVAEFIDRYGIVGIEDKLFFMEVDVCPFLTENDLCQIEEAKPFFCRNYIPFIDTPGSPIYAMCQGIGTGREWTEEEIRKRYDTMLEELVITVKEASANGDDSLCD